MEKEGLRKIRSEKGNFAQPNVGSTLNKSSIWVCPALIGKLLCSAEKKVPSTYVLKFKLLSMAVILELLH